MRKRFVYAMTIPLCLVGCGHSGKVVDANKEISMAKINQQTFVASSLLEVKKAGIELEKAKVELETEKLRVKKLGREFPSAEGSSFSLNKAEGGSDGQPCEDLCQFDACGESCQLECPEEYNSLCTVNDHDEETARTTPSTDEEDSPLSVSDNKAEEGSVIVSVAGNGNTGNTFNIGGEVAGHGKKKEPEGQSVDPIEAALAEALKKDPKFFDLESDFERNTGAVKEALMPFAWPLAGAYMANQAAGVAEEGIRSAGRNINAGELNGVVREGNGPTAATPDMSTNVDDHSVTGKPVEGVE